MERGGVGGLLLLVFCILAGVMWGTYYLFKADEAPARAPTPLVETAEQLEPKGGVNVRATRSFVILDGAMAFTPLAVYFRSGTDTDGEPLYTRLEGADPSTFETIGTAVPPLPPPAPAPQPVGISQGFGITYVGFTEVGEETGTPYSVTFYRDEDTVYMVVESGGSSSPPQVVVGADPDTFQILTAEYSKDDTQVFVVVVTCSGGTCTGTVSVVVGADPETFLAFPNTQSVMNSDCTGYVFADSQDANNVFNNGQVVDGVSVYLIGQNGECDDTPQLISP